MNKLSSGHRNEVLLGFSSEVQVGEKGPNRDIVLDCLEEVSPYGSFSKGCVEGSYMGLREEWTCLRKEHILGMEKFNFSFVGTIATLLRDGYKSSLKMTFGVM